jgi:glyoxylase-like metal-dependent hydrolase (beta-lactamase superfamily II)
MARRWDELGDGVFRRRYDELSLNVGVVVAADGVLVIDTRASHVQGRRLRTELGELTSLPLRWVINTHWHWDHTFGNAVFAEVPIHGHARCRERLLADGENAKREAVGWMDPARHAEIEEVVVTPPDVVFDEQLSIDLGSRAVTMRYLGTGHTDNDIVVSVSDAPVVFAGDLLEESAPPYFGDGYPLAWPDTVARVLDLPGEIFVPGHGDVMSRERARRQHDELLEVARCCADGLATNLFDPGNGPYEESTMRTAWERARLEAQGSR